tara:strand:+ start:1814 stop:2824 length:1011 start_codon:yes stop_codon:yes gene_type:complete
MAISQRNSQRNKPANRKKTEKKEQPRRSISKPGGLSVLFRNHQQVAVDSLDRLFATAAASTLTWVMIAIAIALPLFLFLLLQNLQQFGNNIDEAAQISLFMELDASEAELLNVQNALNSHSGIAATELISTDQALLEFQNLSGFGDALSGLDENPLPAVIVLSPVSESLAEIRTLVAEVAELDGVDYVQFDLDWLQRMYGILNLAQRLTITLGILLALGVALVVGNTVRLAIENRRAEIVVVKLVGGTDSYVARPFLYTGLWYGVGGGLIASVLVLLAQFVMQGPVSNLAGLYDGDFALIGLSLSEISLVLLGSGFLGWFGAWLSVLRHLRAIEPR